MSNDRVIPDFRVNIVLVGESGVGKTCLMYKYLFGEFLTNVTTTIGTSLNSKQVEFFGKKIAVRLWDPAGTERYHAVLLSLFRDAHAAIMVYDVGSQSSFENLGFWLQEIENNCETHVVKVLVANKTDQVHRSVSKEDGKERAKSLGIPYMETSAKDGDNVDAVFETVMYKALQNPDLCRVEGRNAITLEAQPEEESRPWYKRWC